MEMSKFVTEIKNEQGRGWMYEIWWRTSLTMIASGFAETRAMARHLANAVKGAYEFEYRLKEVKTLNKAKAKQASRATKKAKAQKKH